MPRGLNMNPCMRHSAYIKNGDTVPEFDIVVLSQCSVNGIFMVVVQELWPQYSREQQMKLVIRE